MSSYRGGLSMKVYRPYIALISIIIFFLIIFFVNRFDDKISVDNPNGFNNGWSYEALTIDLPHDLNIEPGQTYTIEKVLTTDFHEPQFLLIRSSLSNIKVYLEGTLIYEKTYGDSLSNPYASMWHLVQLPRHIDGQTISISFNSPYTAMSGQINEIFYGSEAMHHTYLKSTYGFRLLIGVISFFVGILIMLSDFIFTRKHDRGYAQLGLFVVFLSLWMIAESRMLQFYTGSTLLIGSLAYLSLPLFPIPLSTYIMENVAVKYKKIFIYIKYFFLAQFFFVITMYLTNTLDFFESVIITQVEILITIILVGTLLVIEYKKENNQKALSFIKIFGFLTIFVVLEFINFLLNAFQNTSIFLSVGFVVILLGVLFNYVKYLIQRLKLSYESEIYAKLAYMDHVTQGKNRLAFERDLDLLFKDPERKSQLRLVAFDLDDLKGINDAYGHVEGDRAIKKAFEMITDVFATQGTCYRIGGDEFACLFENNDETLYQELTTKLNEMIKQFENETPYHFGLSFGSSLIENDQIEPLDLVNLADIQMYENKRSHKLEKQ
jgi:diguanylate cyclase (GGDEF)-like protein